MKDDYSWNVSFSNGHCLVYWPNTLALRIIKIFFLPVPGADPGFGVRGDEIRQGDLRVLLLSSRMLTERMMQEN